MAPGHNSITRQSRDAACTVPDVPGVKEIEEHTESGDQAWFKQFESATGMPNRFLLPKGNPNGMNFDLVVFVSDGEKDSAQPDLHLLPPSVFNHYGYEGVYPDHRPHGFPLDRRVDDERIFEDLPNFKHIQVKIFHDPTWPEEPEHAEVYWN